LQQSRRLQAERRASLVDLLNQPSQQSPACDFPR
jgi:hypothetical protein